MAELAPLSTAPLVVTPLVTVGQLATWARETIAVDDAFALEVIRQASALVADTAGHPEWETDSTALIPRDALRICLMVAKRTYQNPDAVVSEGGIGPIGGDRYLDLQAYGLRLSDEERDLLVAMVSDPSLSGGGSLWVQPISGGTPLDRTVYIADDSGSDWMIPYGDFDSSDFFTEPGDTFR